MNGSEEFKQPVGHIGMVLHRGGEYDPETNTVKGGELLEKIEFKNLIVNSASVLMAMRMAPGVSQGDNTGTFMADGLQYLAVGTIIPEYNDTLSDAYNNFNWMNPPAATVDDTRLKHEIFRKEFTSWTFLNSDGESTGNESTNILRLATTFLENEAVGPLVEMGLFGGNANPNPNFETGVGVGYMFNYKTFPVNTQAA